MLYREIIAVCPQIHTKHKNTLCGQNVEMLNVKPSVQTGTPYRTPNFRESLYNWIPIKILSQLLPHYRPAHRPQHFSIPR
jgi:hypothetical protein